MISVQAKLAGWGKQLKKLPRLQAILAGIVILSVVSALMANIFYADHVSIAFGAPALFFTGWAFVGHLLTIDDDMSGECSNPEGDQRLWQHSLLELLLKAAAFIGVLLVVFV